MAEVFDAQIRTRTSVTEKQLKSDRTLPPPGSLKYGSIASDSALSGTTGVDCMKVEGARWQQMDGNLVENYTGDKFIEVKGKHSEKTHGDHALVVVSGDLSRKVSTGSVSEQVGKSHDVKVGVGFSLNATRADFNASGRMDIKGAMVKINS